MTQKLSMVTMVNGDQILITKAEEYDLKMAFRRENFTIYETTDAILKSSIVLNMKHIVSISSDAASM